MLLSGKDQATRHLEGRYVSFCVKYKIESYMHRELHMFFFTGRDFLRENISEECLYVRNRDEWHFKTFSNVPAV